MKTSRASSADRHTHCSGAMLAPDIKDHAESAPAVDGQAAHEIAKRIDSGEDVTDEDIEDVAKEFGSEDIDMLHRCAAYTVKARDALAEWFPNVMPEHRFPDVTLASGLILTGQTDRVSAIMNDTGGCEFLAVGDWKAGYGQFLHPGQLKQYSTLAVEEFGFPRSGYVFACEIHLQHQETHRHKFTAMDLADFTGKLEDRWKDAEFDPDPDHAAGEWCAFCPRANECELHAAHLRGTIGGLVQLPSQEVSRETLGQIYPQYQQAKRAVEAYDKMLKAALREGPVPLGDGRKLENKTHLEDKILVEESWDYLMGEVGADELAKILSVPKGKLLTAASKDEPKGKGAAKKREVMAALRKLGAIAKKPKTKRTIVG